MSGLSDKPQHVNKNCWYYEGEKSIDIIFNPSPGVNFEIVIPWHKLVKSANRRIEYLCDKPLKKRKVKR